MMNETVSATSQNGIQLEVNKAQVEHIYVQSKNAFLGQPLSAIVALFFVSLNVPTLVWMIWFIAFLILQFMRYVHALHYHKIKPLTTPQEVRFWGNAHVIWLALTAVMWSIGLIVFWHLGDGFDPVIFFAIVTITITAAVVGHTAHRQSYIAYMVFTFAPMGLRFLAEGTIIFTVLGISCFLALAMLTRIGNRAYKSNIESFILAIRYREQAQVLANEKAKTEALNQQLQTQADALRASEARFRGLSQATFEGLAIHKDGRILDANRSALEMFGYQQHDIKDLAITELIASDDIERALEHSRENYELPYEVRGIRKNGQVFPMEIQGKTIPYENMMTRVVALRDLTFRKEAEQQALDLKLEQERVRVLTTFFQNASHEFRTPLSIINTALYVIRHSDDPEKQGNKLDQISEQVSQIDLLVNDLTLLVKLDTDWDFDNYEKVNVHDVITLVSDGIRHTTELKHQTLSLEFDSCPMILYANADLLQRAFYAIIDNAVRYSDDNSTIHIVTKQDNNQATIAVDDAGIGIASEDLPRVFERFYRADVAHTTSGFGIGLSIAYRIVEQHNGEIHLESTVGQGATVTVRLPLASPHGEKC